MPQSSIQPVARLTFRDGTLLLPGGCTPPDPGKDTWTWDGRVGLWRCDAIHYAAVREALAARLGEAFRDDVPQPARVFWPKVALPPPRPEQAEALRAWMRGGPGSPSLAAFGAPCRGQVIMPTGTGKTEVALAAMVQTRVATLVVAPVRDLMYQWHRRILKGLGYDAGILGDNLYNLKSVTVATYDSACIHAATIGALFGLVVFDEEHHLPGPIRRDAALMCTAPMRLGLTATPERSDGRHVDLDWLIGPVVYRLGLGQVRGRTLAEYNVVRIPVALNETEQAAYDQYSRQVRHFIVERRKQQSGYTWRDLCEESGKDPAARLALKAYWLKQAIEDRAAEKLRVLEDIFRLHAGQRTIIFAGSNAMAMEVSRRFLVPTILSHTRKKERLAVLDGFARGDLPVLVANRVLDEGIDVPEAKVAVVIGGQASTRQAQQRLGRILRKSGSVPAVLYEVVCQETKENERSRARRRTEAFDGTKRGLK